MRSCISLLYVSTSLKINQQIPTKSFSNNSEKISFIKDWKEAEALTRPKGTTRNPNKLWLVLKAILWICARPTLIWWYPDLKSNLEKIVAPWSSSNSSSTIGIGYLFFLVNSFKWQQSTVFYTHSPCTLFTDYNHRWSKWTLRSFVDPWFIISFYWFSGILLYVRVLTSPYIYRFGNSRYLMVLCPSKG